MIKTIDSFGDSFMFGCDLSDCTSPDQWWNFETGCSQLTWPALVAKSLDLSYHSCSKGGVGNQFIAEYVIASSVRDDAKDRLFIINWTWINRFDYHTHDYTFKTLRPSESELDTVNFYYKNLHSEISDKFRNLCWISTAHQCLKDQGIKFISTIMDPLLLEETKIPMPHISKLQNKVSKDISWFPNNQTFLGWSRSNGYPESDNWHPLEQAHEEAAKIWRPIYENAINTHITKEE